MAFYDQEIDIDLGARNCSTNIEDEEIFTIPEIKVNINDKELLNNCNTLYVASCKTSTIFLKSAWRDYKLVGNIEYTGKLNSITKKSEVKIIAKDKIIGLLFTEPILNEDSYYFSEKLVNLFEIKEILILSSIYPNSICKEDYYLISSNDTTLPNGIIIDGLVSCLIQICTLKKINNQTIVIVEDYQFNGKDVMKYNEANIIKTDSNIINRIKLIIKEHRLNSIKNNLYI